MVVHSRVGVSRRFRLAPGRLRPPFFHASGHSSNTRVRCRMVNLIRGRCLTAAANISRALSRLIVEINRNFLAEADYGRVDFKRGIRNDRRQRAA
jgi:hypothetical protein